MFPFFAKNCNSLERIQRAAKKENLYSYFIQLYTHMEEAIQRCGFTAATAEWLIEQGFETTSDLLAASESDIDTLARNLSRHPHPDPDVKMPFMAVKRLKGFRFWVDECERTGFIPDPASFGDADVAKYTGKLTDYTEVMEASKSEESKKPETLKKLANWTLWNESFLNYLRQQMGAAKVPLIWLTRDAPPSDEAEELDPDDFPNDTEYLIQATVFEGRHFTMDNARLYRELKSVIVNGEGWTYIKRYEKRQDGREAYMALKLQCEGTASKITRKNKAYASIATAAYSGERRTFRFQDYINIHQNAHNEIYDCDPTEAVPESKKVSDFLKGITDPKLESAITVVLGDTHYMNDFQACQQYLSTTVENRGTLDKSKDKRSISAVNTQDGGGRRSAGGAGTAKLPKGFKLENKWYPKKIFNLLSQAQKKQLQEWGKKDSSNTPDKRSVAALKKEIKDEIRNELAAVDGEEEESEDDTESAGRKFGRGAHKKSKKK